MKVLVLLALVITGVVCVETLEQQFKRLNATPLGKQIFDSLFVQTKTSKTNVAANSVEHLANLLEDLEDQYHNDQKESDQMNKDYQQACDHDIDAYDTDIHDSEYTITTVTAKLESSLYPQREIQTNVLNNKNKELAKYRAELAEAQTERDAENQAFEERLAEHNEAARIIAEAKGLFQDNLVQSSFLEKDSKKQVGPSYIQVTPLGVKKIRDHFQYYIAEMQKTQHIRKSYGSIMQVLATIAMRVEATADQGTVNRIIQLCEDLLSRISNSIDLERQSEDQRAKAFQDLSTMIYKNINAIQDVIAGHQAQLSALADRIQHAENTKNYTETRLVDIKEQREQRYIECQESALDYEQERKARDERRKIVSEIIAIERKNEKWFREQIALRIAAGDNIH